MVATRKICAGERILAEAPLFTVELRDGLWMPHELWNAIRQLSFGDMARFLLLHNAHEGKLPHGTDRFQTNCMRMSGDTFGIFLQFSRINHQCRPNVAPMWDGKRQVQTVHAIKAIQRGEELGVCYAEPFGTSAERQRELKKWHGFDCACGHCKAGPAAVGKSDERRQRIRLILAAMDSGSYPADENKALLMVRHFPSARDMPNRISAITGREGFPADHGGRALPRAECLLRHGLLTGLCFWQ